ncbi:hypothetical protein XELAEV_18006595mg [Xenopus laevis]|uniref:Uncharacterized protein n=1 Tax=Xenopus laevis TaxID=8355 RepID=A0A974I3N5_XENLA|nr:hypothetical protein XELAEV_18006595mg [Xenopus laevis]
MMYSSTLIPSLVEKSYRMNLAIFIHLKKKVQISLKINGAVSEALMVLKVTGLANISHFCSFPLISDYHNMVSRIWQSR